MSIHMPSRGACHISDVPFIDSVRDGMCMFRYMLLDQRLRAIEASSEGGGWLASM